MSPHVGPVRPDAGQTGPVTRPPGPVRWLQIVGQRSVDGDAGGPDHGGRLQTLTIVETDGVLFNFNHRPPEWISTPLSFSALLRRSTRRVGKGRQQLRREIDQQDPNLRFVDTQSVTSNDDLH
jgi:hypothetical protein